MAETEDMLGAPALAKGVGLCYVISLCGGWLTRETFDGTASDDNKAAALVLDMTLAVFIAVLVFYSRSKSKRDLMTPVAKRIGVFSAVMIPICFATGWFSDLSLASN